MPDTRQFSMEPLLRDSPSGASPSLAELVAVGLCGTPCCGHIALCDGLCRDVMRADEDRVQPLRLKPR